MASEEMIFEYFFANLAFLLPWQSIKFSSLDKIHMVGRGLLKEHVCKTFVKISAINAHFHFSHYKSMATKSCHSNQSSYPTEQKTQKFVPLSYSCRCICEIWYKLASWLQRRYRLKMLMDGRRTDACLYYKLTYEPSGELIICMSRTDIPVC